MKKILFALLCVAMLITAFAACDNGTNKTGEESIDLSALPDNEVIKLVASGITDYVIVRGDTSSEREIEAVKLLRDAITEKTGVTAKISTDWFKKGDEASIPAKEILVGETVRDESKNAFATLTNSTFTIRVVGEKIVILGNSPIGTYKAVEYFINNYITTPDEKNGELRILRALSVDMTYDNSMPHTIIDIPTSLPAAMKYMQQDTARLITCMQGLINRDFATTDMLVHQTYDANDTFWLEYMMEDGNFFNGYSVIKIDEEKDFWAQFTDYIKSCGLVVWDPAVPSTANVASTICGVDGYLPVKYDTTANSLYTKLLELGVEVKLSLVDKFTGTGTIPDTDIPSSGSTKCDAYLWALELYMDKCSTEVMAYVLDGAGCVPGSTTYEGAEGTDAFYNAIYNHDYFVAEKAFCFDLTSNAAEAPFDDPTQPKGTDRETLCKILQAAYDRSGGNFTQVVGFPPWWMKYTVFLNRGNIGEVDLEWQFAQLASTYNCALEADCAHPCCMTNASLYSKYPIADNYENNTPAEKLTFDDKTRYFTIYIGDYDASAWLKSVVPGFWADGARGTVALNWGFNPNLSKRIPMVFEYVYKNKTDKDYFLTGDSGAGYVNPGALINGKDRELPTASEKWVEYNAPLLKQFDMDITGFILNGALKFTNDIYEMYHQISPIGAFSNNPTRLTVYKGTPIIQMTDYSETPGDAYNQMKNRISFTTFRTVRKSPSQIAQFITEIEEYANSKNDGYTYKYVDAYTMFDLILQSGQGKIYN